MNDTCLLYGEKGKGDYTCWICEKHLKGHSSNPRRVHDNSSLHKRNLKKELETNKVYYILPGSRRNPKLEAYYYKQAYLKAITHKDLHHELVLSPLACTSG